MKSLLILFLFILYPLTSFAEIDERKTDIYFANGILTDEGNATANTDLLMSSILKEKYNNNLNKMKQEVGKIEEAYNSTHGEIADLYESMQQKLSGSNDFNMNSYLPEFFVRAHSIWPPHALALGHPAHQHLATARIDHLAS